MTCTVQILVPERVLKLGARQDIHETKGGVEGVKLRWKRPQERHASQLLVLLFEIEPRVAEVPQNTHRLIHTVNKGLEGLIVALLDRKEVLHHVEMQSSRLLVELLLQCGPNGNGVILNAIQNTSELLLN